ncbi:MAG: DUF4292 domain-containing protein [Bacteroidota bacterium]
MTLHPAPSRIWIVFLVPWFLLFSCKSSKVGAGELDKGLSAKNIIRKHYQSQTGFKTLKGKLKIAYSDGESSQTVNVSFRMERDKAIWLSAPLGLVKAYITPNRVSFYNKLQNEYFDGDFSYISDILGTPLDFNNLQNLLLGQALFDLREGKYTATPGPRNYIVKPKNPISVFKTLFQIEPENFKIASLQLSQPVQKRILEVAYTDYQNISSWILPKTIGIKAIEGDEINTIALEYRNMEFNKPLSFPYKIPKGFSKIAMVKDEQ